MNFLQQRFFVLPLLGRNTNASIENSKEQPQLEMVSREVQVSIDAVKVEMIKHQFNEQKTILDLYLAS